MATGAYAVDQASRTANKNIALQKEWLKMLQQIFNEGMASIADARANGVFDPMKMRETVQRNVTNLNANVAARGLIAGAKEGDTTQSERIAQATIAGGRALENVDFEALQRELGALQSIIPSAQLAGQGFQGVSNANLQGLGLVQNAQNMANQQLGSLAGLGFQFLNSTPTFNANVGGVGWTPRPGKFG